MKFELTPLKAGLLAAGIVGIGFFLKSMLEQDKTPVEVGGLSVEQTRQLFQEIKYQMLSVSVNYAQKMTRQMIRFIPPTQFEATKRTLAANIMKNYEYKEKVILGKHDIKPEEYSEALRKYENDDFIKKNTAELLEMMERAGNGEYPNLDVHPEAMTVNNQDQMRQIYFEVSLMVTRMVWKTICDFLEKEPGFDPAKDEDFKKAIKTIKIYETKRQYLQSKGYKPQWGCPNEIFLKVTENYIKDSQIFRIRMRSIEQSYNFMIETISRNPKSVTEAEIQTLLKEQVKKFQEEQTAKIAENQPNVGLQESTQITHPETERRTLNDMIRNFRQSGRSSAVDNNIK